MNFKNMTKQQLKDYGQTIGVQLNLKNKKDELITQLNEAVEQKAELNSTPVPTEQAPPSPLTASVTPSQGEFDIKKYALPIVVVMILLIWLY
jgi:hypothetical protein